MAVYSCHKLGKLMADSFAGGKMAVSFIIKNAFGGIVAVSFRQR